METLVQDLLTPIVGEVVEERANHKTPFMVHVLRWFFRIGGRIAPGWCAPYALKIFGTPQRRYLRTPPSSLMKNAEVVETKVEGMTLTSYIWDNTGPTVLLVHGWETGGLHLFGFVEPLWALGFRIVAMDGPAHGRSQGNFANLPNFAAAITQNIKTFGPVHHIIAHSFGGAASMYAAYDKQLPLEKLVLVSVPNKLPRIIGDFTRYLRIPKAVENKMKQLILKRFKVDPELMEISSLGNQVNIRKILVVHDRYDQIVPFYNALEIGHALAQAEVLPCEHLGHNRILKNPQVTTRVAQFLKDQII